MKLDDLQPQRRTDYVWVNVGLCFLMVFTCLGFCSSGKSFYLTAITNALDIPRSAFSVNDSCRYIATAVVNLFFGALFRRLGAKKLIAAGFICLIASCLIYSLAENILVFYAGGILLGVGLSWTTTTMVSAIIHKRCRKNVGSIMGAVLAANGIGGAIAVQMITPVIFQEGNPFGYRSSYRLVALILAIVGALIVILLREKAGAETAAAPAVRKKSRSGSWVGMDFSSAVRQPYFYAAAICIFLTGMILQGITGIATPHMLDMGLSAGYVTAISSIHSLFLAGSKFLTGFLFDKFGLRTTMNLSLAASMLTMVILTLITNSLTGRVLVAAYTFISAVALPLETIMLPLYVSSFFGDKAYNKLLGIFLSVNTAGYAIGAPVANLFYDFFGSYRIAFVISGLLMLCVTVIMQKVCRAAEQEKQMICVAESNITDS